MLCTQKPASTPTFCKRNVFRMNHIEMLNLLTFFLTTGDNILAKMSMLVNFEKTKCVIDINVMFSNFRHQIEPWFVIDFFAQILMISNNFPFYYKYELLGHFPYSNFANGYKFLTRIKKKITNKDFF